MFWNQWAIAPSSSISTYDEKLRNTFIFNDIFDFLYYWTLKSNTKRNRL